MEKLNAQSFPLPGEIALALVKSPEQIEKFCRELVERGMNGDFSSPVTEYMLKMSKGIHGAMDHLRKKTMDAPVSGNFSSEFSSIPNDSARKNYLKERGIMTEQDYKEYKLPTFASTIGQELGLIIVEKFRGDQKALSEIGRAWIGYTPTEYNYASPVLFRVVELSDDLNLLEDLRFAGNQREDDESDSIGLREIALGKMENPFLQLVEERIDRLKVISVGRETTTRFEEVIQGK